MPVFVALSEVRDPVVARRRKSQWLPSEKTGGRCAAALLSAITRWPLRWEPREAARGPAQRSPCSSHGGGGIRGMRPTAPLVVADWRQMRFLASFGCVD
jgi:hypothetical protein